MFDIKYTNNEVSLRKDKDNECTIAKDILAIKRLAQFRSFYAFAKSQKAVVDIDEKANGYACYIVGLLAQNYGFSASAYTRANFPAGTDFTTGEHYIRISLPTSLSKKINTGRIVKATPDRWVKYLHDLRLVLNKDTAKNTYAIAHQR